MVQSNKNVDLNELLEGVLRWKNLPSFLQLIPLKTLEKH